MVVAVFVAPQAGMYGAMLFVSRFLATNARMGVAKLVAVLARIYGVMLFASRFLARNARMGVAMLVAPKTKHSCIRG